MKHICIYIAEIYFNSITPSKRESWNTFMHKRTWAYTKSGSHQGKAARVNESEPVYMKHRLPPHMSSSGSSKVLAGSSGIPLWLPQVGTKRSHQWVLLFQVCLITGSLRLLFGIIYKAWKISSLSLYPPKPHREPFYEGGN